uniref:hypothetical protein n=1 Tax=Klebsiella aerogenes TaxID=548 RepID=UPI0013D353EB
MGSGSRADTWLSKYSSFVCSVKGRVACIMVLLGMYALTTYGVVTMKTTFELE